MRTAFICKSLLALLSATLLFGCAKEDENNKRSPQEVLNGQWNLVSSETGGITTKPTKANTIESLESDDFCCSQLEIHSNTFALIDTDFVHAKKETFSWALQNGTIKLVNISDANDVRSLKVISLSASFLVVESGADKLTFASISKKDFAAKSILAATLPESLDLQIKLKASATSGAIPLNSDYKIPTIQSKADENHLTCDYSHKDSKVSINFTSTGAKPAKLELTLPMAFALEKKSEEFIGTSQDVSLAVSAFDKKFVAGADKTCAFRLLREEVSMTLNGVCSGFKMDGAASSAADIDFTVKCLF